MTLKPFHPYLFTAYYDWLVDNHITPHLKIDTRVKGVVVPEEYVENHSIVLSINPPAINSYRISSKGISFKAMFRGQARDVRIPFAAMEDLIAVELREAFPIGSILNYVMNGDSGYGEWSDDDEEDDEFNQDDEMFTLENSSAEESSAQSAPSEDDEPDFELVDPNQKS